MPNTSRITELLLINLGRGVGGLLMALCIVAVSQHVFAQEPAPAVATDPTAPRTPENAPQAPERVEVEPSARDHEIAERLTEILRATGWFTAPQVAVDEGVVFLEGSTDQEQNKEWARELAQNTEGVVAVVNRIGVVTPTVWDFTPARDELRSLGEGLVRGLPVIVVALIVLLFAWLCARLARGLLRRLLRRRVSSPLLLEAGARAGGILVFLLGLYLVLRISGLSRLAVTVIGGTGLIGLVLGIAFRDITENFLASLFLSLQQPFREGDLVELAGITGYVQRLTSRTTVLLTLQGNQVQVPNATVFKSVIRNFTSNPNRREDFSVGIGYQDAIPHAQEVALEVLANHPAVLKDPEPWVLVDNLGASTVNLRVYFWLDGSQHSSLKVRSSVIRLVKRAFQDAEISLPDEAREMIFPEGVPVRMLDSESSRRSRQTESVPRGRDAEGASTTVEGSLYSEAHDIQEQARQAWSPDEGENLLTKPSTPVADSG
jgi:small conductance mechanosensitive channel